MTLISRRKAHHGGARAVLSSELRLCKARLSSKLHLYETCLSSELRLRNMCLRLQARGLSRKSPWLRARRPLLGLHRCSTVLSRIDRPSSCWPPCWHSLRQRTGKLAHREPAASLKANEGLSDTLP